MINKGICQYCKNEFDQDSRKRTAEHIIPSALIELFPDQYISYSNNKKFIDNKGVTIADVCKKCNGTHLSKLDEYGKYLISKNFYEKIPFDLKDNLFPIDFDYYKLTRWVIKILYNLQRVNNKDTSWFQRAIGYMLYDIRIENFDFSIFAGIHINSTPLPEEYFEYKPLQINYSPRLIGNSLGLCTLGIDPYVNSIEVKSAFCTYSIRFGTLILYIILWDHTTELKIKKYFSTLLECEFNFAKISPNKTTYYLKRVSAQTNVSMGYWHIISNSGIIQDDMFVQKYINGKSVTECQELFRNSRSKESEEKAKVLIEMAQFPNNNKIIKKYNKLFDKK